jgi:hypothetical protein
MRAMLAVIVTVIGALCAAGVSAHHSFASEYTADKPVAMKGVITRVEWTNPHARFYIDVIADDDTVTNWNVELASPSALSRNGWSSRSLLVGDEISITGFGARKDNTYRVNVRSATLTDGRTVFNGRAQDTPE